jgi:hypothetical protein
MSVQFLFNSSGEWIAFRQDRFVWDKDSELIGWLPWDDVDVVTIDGEYLGTIYGLAPLLVALPESRRSWRGTYARHGRRTLGAERRTVLVYAISASSTCHSARASSSSNVMISGSYRLRR